MPGYVCTHQVYAPGARRPDMGTQNFIRFNLVSQTFDSNQLMTNDVFTSTASNQLTTQNGFLKFDSNRPTAKKKPKILAHINS